MDIPSPAELIRGCEEYDKHVKRDFSYNVSLFYIRQYWRDPLKIGEALSVLLYQWNSAFYRYGSFDIEKLEKCIECNLSKLDEYRSKDIMGLSPKDEDSIINLFDEFNEALQISNGKMKNRKSPVSVAKALHLLAPHFFPIWDAKIAKAYNCSYDKEPALKYVKFCKMIREEVKTLTPYINCDGKSILKMIDEYNFSKYSHEWIT
jgi:hypothetical protein